MRATATSNLIGFALAASNASATAAAEGGPAQAYNGAASAALAAFSVAVNLHLVHFRDYAGQHGDVFFLRRL